jgi:hypothetical protein
MFEKGSGSSEERQNLHEKESKIHRCVDKLNFQQKALRKDNNHQKM